MTINITHLRQQWPVGHGFFHTASVNVDSDDKTYRYVYDCGSVARTLVEDRIEKYASNEALEHRAPELDMLVLSHFHEDHIDGVPHLLESFSVKKLVLPYLANEFALTALASLAASDPMVWSEFSGLVLDPVAWLQERGHGDTEITLVQPDVPPDGPRQRANGEADGVVLPVGATSHYETGTIRAAGTAFWDFRFYVQEHWGRYFLLLGALYEKFNPASEQDLLAWLSDPAWIAAHHLDVKEVFRSLGSSNQNGITLCMYSGPTNGRPVHGYVDWPSHKPVSLPYHSYRSVWSNGLGWLGTGDAELQDPMQFKAFVDHYDFYIQAIDTITVPHHGSIDNYCGGLGNLGASAVLTSDHTEDPHDHHPNPVVMMNLRTKCSRVFIVTKEMNSAVFSRSRIFLD